MVDRADIHGKPLIAALLISLALGNLLILAYDASWPVRCVAGLCVSYLVLSLFLHPRQSLASDPFAMHVVARVMVLFGYVLSCLYVSSGVVRINDDLILLALGIGLGSVLLADLLVLFVPLPPDARLAGDSTSLEARLFLLLFAAGWLWRAYAFSRGLLYGTFIGTRLELTGASNIMGTLNSLATLGMWGCVVFARRSRWTIPLVAMEVIWLLATGSKGAVLYILVPFLMVLFQRGTIRINGRFVAGMGAILVLFMATFVVVHGYRVAVAKQVAGAGYAGFEASEALTTIEVDPNDFVLIGKSLTERLNLAERYLLILERDEAGASDPWYGQSYLTAMLWFVPRAVWPGKPSMSLGRWFATEYLGWGEESRSEAGVTVWGEGFLNFRIIGAILVPGLWIAFLQLIYSLALRRGRWGILFVASGYLVMMNSLSANVALPIAGLAQLLLILLFLRVLIVAMRRAARRLEVRPVG